jgi:thiamine-monophosphate kinase
VAKSSKSRGEVRCATSESRGEVRCATSELARIARIRGALATSDPRVILGIGDDAAILAATGEPLVWTIDAAVDGVHFRRAWMSLEDVGYRATMAAASDLAAMGATPLALLAGLVLPSAFDDADLDALVAGQRAAADAIGAPLVGGNLARGGELSITTTALGRTPSPLTRSGARAGDAVAIAGPVGLAGAGLLAAERRLATTGAAPAVAAFRRPRARIAEGLAARGVARAAIDVSDGLAHDLAQLARASDVVAELDASRLVGASLAAAARELAVDPLELALHGGEDYALVIALPPGASIAGFTVIVAFAARGSADADVLLRREDSTLVPLAPRGFDHFAGS